MKFRTKPIEVEARELTPTSRKSIVDWIGSEFSWYYESNSESELYIQTRTSRWPAQCAVEGDIIVRDQEGFTIWKPDAFAKAFDVVE